MSQLPLLEEAIIQDMVIPQESGSGGDKASVPGKTSLPGTGAADDQPAGDYWAGYRESGASQIPSTDKLKVLYLMKRNLSSEEMKLIVSLIQGGITPSEQSEIKTPFKSKLTDADRAELKKVVLKYF